jgi:hypothetical protein
MFFERLDKVLIDGLEYVVDGNKYVISNAANIDHFNCKLHLCSIWQV